MLLFSGSIQYVPFSYVFAVVYQQLVILLPLSGSLPSPILLPFAPAQPYSSPAVSEKVCKYLNRRALYIFHVMIVGKQMHHLRYSCRILAFMKRYSAETGK
jgi:hypothetical protein